MDSVIQYPNELRGKNDVHSLLQSLSRYQDIRSSALSKEGSLQIQYTKSTDGWLLTLIVIKGRALDLMTFPWSISVLHAIIYILVQELWIQPSKKAMETWEVFFSFALNSTLSFLLVFRLNRAAGRFWTARHYWGDIVAKSRSFVGGIIVHGSHDSSARDNCIRWIVAFSMATMNLLREEKEISENIFAGILSQAEVHEMQKQVHPPLYAMDRARYHLKQLFHVDENLPPHLAFSRSQEMNSLENQLNAMIWCGGGMERIKGTPLPIVYVSHLRTFILITLLLYPWVFGAAWGWMTIPAVAVAAFAALGIECSAMEVEAPFRSDRVNALNMDGYILGLLSTIKQQLKTYEDNASH